MEFFKVAALEFVHGGFGLLGVVVVAEHVQDSVHEQQSDLVVEASCMARCLPGCNCGTDDDVTEEQRMVVHVDRFLRRSE